MVSRPSPSLPPPLPLSLPSLPPSLPPSLSPPPPPPPPPPPAPPLPDQPHLCRNFSGVSNGHDPGGKEGNAVIQRRVMRVRGERREVRQGAPQQTAHALPPVTPLPRHLGGRCC